MVEPKLNISRSPQQHFKNPFGPIKRYSCGENPFYLSGYYNWISGSSGNGLFILKRMQKGVGYSSLVYYIIN